MASCQVHFGGPGRPDGGLRDLLAERVSQVPAGGAIDWVTYYLRDRRLAGELVAARRRGVAVRVTLEGRPRTTGANTWNLVPSSSSRIRSTICCGVWRATTLPSLGQCGVPTLA